MDRMLSTFAAFILAAGSATAGTDKGAEFSEEEVRQDVERYVATVFGATAPTLATYNSFEGAKDEAEYELELQECKKRWGAAFQSGKTELTPKCASWVGDRAARADTEASLYYASLRSRIKLDPASLTITKVSCDPGTRNACLITAKAEPVGELEFYHAVSPRMADLGLMGLVAVNGQQVAELVAERTSPARSAD
jgi:hypothetical protein